MKVGLVLSGGGIRGAAHIGAIKAFEECGIHTTSIAGTSAGAIVGALYSYGYDYKEMLDFFKQIQFFDVKKFARNKPGFIDSEKYYKLFSEYFPEDNFKALKKHIVITATDILDGTLRTFNEGELIKPLLASASYPGVFSPIKIDNSYYIDGGALNNFPIEFLKDDCDIILGVHVNPFKKIKITDLKHFHNVLERAFKLRSLKEDLLKFQQCDLIICPEELSKYGTFDKRYIDEIFNIGYENSISKFSESSLAKMDLKS